MDVRTVIYDAVPYHAFGFNPLSVILETWGIFNYVGFSYIG